jgi:hypothetical protein
MSDAPRTFRTEPNPVMALKKVGFVGTVNTFSEPAAVLAAISAAERARLYMRTSRKDWLAAGSHE